MAFWNRISHLFDFGGQDPDFGYLFPPLEPATKTASSGVTSGAGLSWDSLLGWLGPVGSAASGIASLFKSKSGGERASDYTARMLNEYLQNPERAMSLYNKNTDLTNPYFQSMVNGMTGQGLTGAQEQMNRFNAEQAALQRDWQEHMASTQFQRTTADMQAAGLNPAMMYGSNASPASSGSGSAASGGTPSITGIGAIAELIQAASQARMARSASALNQSEVFKNIAESGLIKSQTGLIKSQTKTEDERSGMIIAQVEQILADKNLKDELAKTEQGRRDLFEAEKALTLAKALSEDTLRSAHLENLNASSVEARAVARKACAEAVMQEALNKADYAKLVYDALKQDKEFTLSETEFQKVLKAKATGNWSEVNRDLNWWDSAVNRIAQLFGAVGSLLSGNAAITAGSHSSTVTKK